MVSRSHQRLRLPLDLAEMEALLSAVAVELGWTLEHLSRQRVRFREDATRLHCHCSPLEATLDLERSEAGSTTLTIEGQVPGWGLLAGKHAREQTQLLARHIGLAALAQARGSESA